MSYSWVSEEEELKKKSTLVRRKKLTAQLKDIIDWKGNKYCSEIFPLNQSKVRGCTTVT